MARACSICTHTQRESLDQQLLGAEPLLRISARFRVAESSLRRHRDNHLAPRLANRLARREDLSADRLLAWAAGLHERTLVGLVKAEQAGALAEVRGFIAEARKNLELLGRLGGHLDGPTINVDARRQLAVLGGLSEAELRALAAAGGDVIEGAAVEREGLPA